MLSRKWNSILAVGRLYQVGGKLKWPSDCDQCHEDPNYTEEIISTVYPRF